MSSELHLQASLPLQCLGFRSTYLLRALSRLWWRVGLLAMCWWFGLSALYGDQLYLRGLRHDDVAVLEQAARLFPYERYIAAGPAYYYMRRGVPDFATLAALQAALNDDPWALDMALAQHKVETALGGQ